MAFLFSLSIPITATAILVIFLKIEKGEIITKRTFPSWKEVKEAVAAEKSVMILIVLAFFGQFFSEFGNPYRFIFMKEVLHAPDYLLPLPQTALTVGSLLAGIPSGYLSDVAKKRKLFIVLGSLIASLGVAFNAFAFSPFMLVVTFFLFGLSNVISWTCLQAYFSNVGGARSSLMVGAYLASSWIGGVFSPPLSGYVAETAGLRTSFFIELIGGIIIVCLLAILFKEKTTPQGKNQGENC
jgi:MFS family permease